MEKYGYSDTGNEELTENDRALLDSIGKDVFMVDTLDTRNRDCLDFHDASVWAMREAMKLAFLHGKAIGKGEK